MNRTETIRRAAVALVAIALVAASALGGDPTSRNKAAARRVFDEILSQGKFELSDGLYTKDFIAHGGGKSFTHEQDLEAAKGWRLAFPDLAVSVDLMVAERDLVAIRWTARGTNTGTGNGLPATGKRVEASGLTIYRFVDGKIAEEWSSYDYLSAMRQLGLAPPTASK